VAAAVLFGAGNALWAFSQPSGNATATQVMAFYARHSNGILVGASLSLVSLVAFTVFSCGIRVMVLAAGEDELWATTACAGGLLLVVAGLGAETINMVGALRATDHDLTRSLGEAVFQISYVLGYNAAGVGIAVLLLAMAISGLRRPALMRRPAAGLSIAIAIAFLTPLSRYLLAPAVVLLLAVGIKLVRPHSSGRRSPSA
jgi:dihydrodipicolinate synthase/N-acetylneuraminate lyase